MLKSSVLILGVYCAIISADTIKHATKYNSSDIETVLRHDRILNNYIKCLMDEGPCTAEGRELKRSLSHALVHGCTECSEEERNAAEKVIKHLAVKRRCDLERLAKKYDPKGEYKKRFAAQLSLNLGKVNCPNRLS